MTVVSSATGSDDDLTRFHGKAWKKNLVMESHGKWAKKVMVIENILKKSWNFSTAHHKSH